MTGLDLGPSSLPSLESERPDSLLGVQGVPLPFKQRLGGCEELPFAGSVQTEAGKLFVV